MRNELNDLLIHSVGWKSWYLAPVSNVYPSEFFVARLFPVYL